MRRLRLAGLLAIATVVLGGCATTEDTAGGPTEAPEETATAAPAAEDGEATVAVASSDLGEILVDAQGFTLYLFRNDEDGESTCYATCAGTWPPSTVEGEPTAGEGLDPALLGTHERTDGTTQVTYNGHPLYRFSNDQAPGDANGQGIGGNWYVVSPEGEQIGG
jgi:predicted lipoprotein with Yx(FWY)xxD motif